MHNATKLPFLNSLFKISFNSNASISPSAPARSINACFSESLTSGYTHPRHTHLHTPVTYRDRHNTSHCCQLSLVLFTCHAADLPAYEPTGNLHRPSYMQCHHVVTWVTESSMTAEQLFHQVVDNLWSSLTSEKQC